MERDMLPEVNESSTGDFTGDQLADHIGTQPTSRKADNPARAAGALKAEARTMRRRGGTRTRRYRRSIRRTPPGRSTISTDGRRVSHCSREAPKNNALGTKMNDVARSRWAGLVFSNLSSQTTRMSATASVTRAAAISPARRHASSATAAETTTPQTKSKPSGPMFRIATARFW